MTRRRVRSPGPCPLSVGDVERIVHSRATTEPQSTVDITGICQAAFPAYANINTWRVGKLLEYLLHRDRVTKLSGIHDGDKLKALGVSEPCTRWAYWCSPQRQSGHGRVENAVYPELPLDYGRDGRAPFAAEPGDDEPGVVRELAEHGHPGWWQRRAHDWVPVARPARADT